MIDLHEVLPCRRPQRRLRVFVGTCLRDFDSSRQRSDLTVLSLASLPHRPAGSEAYFLRVDGESLRLHGDVHNDVADFERLTGRVGRTHSRPDPLACAHRHLPGRGVDRSTRSSQRGCRWADRAIRIDRSIERAARIFVASLLTTGNRSGARSAAAEFSAMFGDLDVPREPSTQRLFDQAR